MPDGRGGPSDGGGDGSGVSDRSGDGTGGDDVGTDTGPIDPVAEMAARDAHPVTATSITTAHPTVTRNRMPL
ncbi:MAG TPA: hypothetical protein VIJ96_07020 [Acidothermaceae bacterium]